MGFNIFWALDLWTVCFNMQLIVCVGGWPPLNCFWGLDLASVTYKYKLSFSAICVGGVQLGLFVMYL